MRRPGYQVQERLGPGSPGLEMTPNAMGVWQTPEKGRGGGGEAPVQPSLVPGSGLRLPAGPSNFPAQKPFRDGRQPQDELGLISEETRVNC